MRRRHKITIWTVLILVLSALGYTVQQTGQVGAVPKATPTPGYYAVTHVSDGDTINVQMAGKTETIRFIGIDTPELHDPRKPVQCFAAAASANMHKLVDGKSVRLEADPTDTDRDKYGRLLRYVYLPDGTFVNQVQVQQGFAFAYTIFPNTKLDQFRAWEREARENNRGLWAGCQTRHDGDIEQTNAQ